MEGALKAGLTAFRAVKSQMGVSIYADLVRLFLELGARPRPKERGGGINGQFVPAKKAG
jgi:hypothetical protein